MKILDIVFAPVFQDMGRRFWEGKSDNAARRAENGCVAAGKVEWQMQ
jgi:hypothetical protein